MAADPGDRRVGGLVIAEEKRRTFYRDVELALTSREFDVLAALAAHPGWVLSAEQLSYAEDAAGLASQEAVSVHISHLRGKLARAGGSSLIDTVRGVGWRLREPSAFARGRGRL